MGGIFISHSTRDISIARRLVKKLKQGGKKVWIAEDEVKPGDNLTRRINDAIEQCEVFILCWSENARSSIWVEQEWTAALNDRRLIPCLLDETPLPIILRNRYHIDFRNFNNGLDKLIKSLN